jgi:hypothetical protein
MIYLVFLLAALQVGDVLTTEKILQNGKELNPIMNWLFTKFGMHNVLVVKAVVVASIGVVLWKLYPIILVPLCVLYVCVVAWNVYQIIKVKK